MRATLPAMPFAWIFFVSFIIVGTFMFMNLFVAVVINNLVEAKKEKPSSDALNHQDFIKEVREVRAALVRLESKFDNKK